MDRRKQGVTPLSPSRIAKRASDEALFKLLGGELKRLLSPYTSDDLEPFVKAVEQLPIGLRSMAATYELDVSMALDDLGWHFANWHHQGLAVETLAGLANWGPSRRPGFQTSDGNRVRTLGLFRVQTLCWGLRRLGYRGGPESVE